MRLLGIDYGAARTGLSLSDPLAITCSPLEVVHQRDENLLIDRIRAVVAENMVSEIVLGLPRPLAGGTNAQQAAVEAFGRRLALDLGLTIHMWDERFTSKLAARTAAQERSGRSRSRRPAASTAQDALAACHLLQSYLDARSQTASGKRS